MTGVKDGGWVSLHQATLRTSIQYLSKNPSTKKQDWWFGFCRLCAFWSTLCSISLAPGASPTCHSDLSHTLASMHHSYNPRLIFPVAMKDFNLHTRWKGPLPPGITMSFLSSKTSWGYLHNVPNVFGADQRMKQNEKRESLSKMNRFGVCKSAPPC